MYIIFQKEPRDILDTYIRYILFLWIHTFLQCMDKKIDIFDYYEMFCVPHIYIYIYWDWKRPIHIFTYEMNHIKKDTFSIIIIIVLSSTNIHLLNNNNNKKDLGQHTGLEWHWVSNDDNFNFRMNYSSILHITVIMLTFIKCYTTTQIYIFLKFKMHKHFQKFPSASQEESMTQYC